MSSGAMIPERLLERLAATARSPLPRLLPRAFERGMNVALVSPSSPLGDRERFQNAVDVAESLGLRPRLAPHAMDQRGYLAGRDEDRLADLEASFRDPEIHAIWCLRGGYGALRLLPNLDFDLIREHPKILIGFSDATALHLAIERLTGLVSFHGPMLNANPSAYAVSELERVTVAKSAAGVVGQPVARAGESGARERKDHRFTITSGRARGRLIGGNLTLISRLMGTPFQPNFDGSILFLEDVGEAAYRIDGLLSQLRLAGALTRCAGIVFGHFTDDEPRSEAPRLSTETVLRELTGDLSIPVYSGLACGHVADQTTLPIGIEAEIDADAQTLRLLEPAVR